MAKTQPLITFKKLNQLTKMVKKKKLLGFTLIEIMLVITLSSLLFSAGMVRYLDFNRTQIVKGVAQNVKNQLREIQTKALAGIKPNVAVCTDPAQLDGYRITYVNSRTYQAQAFCEGNASGVIFTYTIPQDTFFELPFTAFDFQVVGQGASVASTIIVKHVTANVCYSLDITTSGVIIDNGIVTCTILPSPSPSIMIPSPTPSATPLSSPQASPSSSPSISPTPTPASSPATVTLYPIADSYVSSDRPNNNYGSQTTLSIDGSPIKIAYLKFDTTSLAGKTVVSATFRVRVCTVSGCSSSSTQNVKQVANTSWVESVINYNNRPALGSIINSFNGGSRGQWRSIDVTTYIAASVGQLIALGIDSSGSDGLDVYSREAASRPELIINYQN